MTDTDRSTHAEPEPQLQWTELTERHGRPHRQALRCLSNNVEIGSILLGVRNADDPDNPYVEFDYVQVAPEYRDRQLSIQMAQAVQAKYPSARLVGGPLSEDDAPGPSFRLRCWQGGVPIHDPDCDRAEPCDCLARLEAEAKRRRLLREWAQWSHMWLAAAERQADRAEQRGSDPDAQSEAMLFVLALHNAGLGAQAVLEESHEMIANFREESSLTQIRDMLSHYDEYVAGDGRLQRRKPRLKNTYKAPWLVAVGGDETTLVILTRTGPDRQQTSYHLNVRSTLRSVADLVSAALRHAGITQPSATIDRIQEQST